MIQSAKKNYIIGASFLVAIALISFLLLFLVNQIKNEGQKMSQARQTLDSFYQNWRNLEKTKQDISAIQNELSGTTALLPSEDAIKFILAVENSAQATQNRESISVSNSAATTQATGAKNTLDFQISLWGSFPNLIKFLVYLENAPYLNTVDSLQIRRLTETDLNSPDAAGSQVGDVNSIITISAFQ